MVQVVGVLFVVLALQNVCLAYPSPDDQLAAELEAEISAAGSDYTDAEGSDYTGRKPLTYFGLCKIIHI
jgi:hypothetical protein